MTDPFMKLPEEKRKIIIDLSLAEFAEKNFTDASTDVITHDAGISKGSLFYYFKNKRGLYLYLLEYVTSMALGLARQRKLEGDGFELLISCFNSRIEFCRQNPIITRFIKRASTELCAEVFKEKQEIINRYLDESDIEIDKTIDYFIKGLPAGSMKVDAGIAKNGIHMFWTALSLYFIESYKQMPEIFTLDSEKSEPLAREYFKMIVYGIIKG